MLTLKKVEINKYKSFLSLQSTSIEKDITAFVGKNESGKTAFLEALAKFNYFQDDPKYKFNVTSDYPRTELKRYQKGDEECEVIKCTFEISVELINKINSEIGIDVDLTNVFSYGIKYEGDPTWYDFAANEEKYIKYLIDLYNLPEQIRKDIVQEKTLANIITFIQKIDYSTYEGINIDEVKANIIKINDILVKMKGEAYAWDNLLQGYIAKKFIQPNFPKFWYFDEYYALPSRININHLSQNKISPELDEEALKTSKALFELANVDINELIQSNDFERFKTELEATSNEITDQIFNYWKTNENLEIEFAIDTKTISTNPHQIEKILDIRVKNKKHRVTLPLRNRSKGFNSFLKNRFRMMPSYQKSLPGTLSRQC